MVAKQFASMSLGLGHREHPQRLFAYGDTT
jgi:hypothetical protein